MPIPTIFEGINPRGTQTLIPCKDNKAQNGVIANTRLLSDTVGWSAKNKATFIQGIIGGDSTSGYGLADNGSSIVAKVDNNTDYIACKKSGQGDRFKIVLFANYPTHTASHDATQIISDNTKTSYKFNSENYNYAVLSYDSSTTIAQNTAEAMIVDADTLDMSYKPYRNTTAFPRDEQAVLGARNISPNDKATQLGYNNVNFVNNGNGTISVDSNGQQASNPCYYGVNAVRLTGLKPNTEYKISGCPAGGSTSTYQLFLRTDPEDNVNRAIDTGNGALLTTNGNITEETPFIFMIIISKNYIADNLLFKPMIKFADDTDDTFSHALTNKQLTDMVSVVDSPCTDIVSGADVLNQNGGNVVHVIGKIAFLNIALEKVTAGAWSNLFAVPASAKPKHTIKFRDVHQNKIFQMTAGGVVQCSEALTDAIVIISISWVIA